MNTLSIVLIIAATLTVVATVLLYIFVLPEKKRDGLPKVGQIVHDILHFKSLFIEKIIRFFYVLTTVWCVLTGFLMLFGITTYEGYYYSHTEWYGGYGILLMILGPIALRVVFETIMMGILLVKNVMQINNKLKSSEENIEE
jgi:hypothetical protein